MISGRFGIDLWGQPHGVPDNTDGCTEVLVFSLILVLQASLVERGELMVFRRSRSNIASKDMKNPSHEGLI